MLRAGLGLLAAGALSAQTPLQTPAVPALQRDAMHAPGKDVTISLLTMGNGPQVEAMFGHSAIQIHDNATGRDTVFNWGVFDMQAPHFIAHFLQGLLLYSMGGNRMEDLLYSYRYWNRSVTSQELDLSAAQKDSIIHIIQVNAQPENVHYRYDYFAENCSTRPRDILDRVLGGQLRVGADSVTKTTYRWQALRLMQGNKLLALGVDIGLGNPADRPITKWEEMFLPKKLHDWVATRQVRDSSGALQPLVKQERVLFQSSRPPEPETPPSYAALVVAGLVLSMAIGALGKHARRGDRNAQVALAFLGGLWATVCGLLGVVVLALSTVTDHRFAHWNENLLLFNPLWLVVAVGLPLFLLRGKAEVVTRRTFQILAVLGLLAFAIHLIPAARQDNVPLIALTMLPAMALASMMRPKRA